MVYNRSLESNAEHVPVEPADAINPFELVQEANMAIILLVEMFCFPLPAYSHRVR